MLSKKEIKKFYPQLCSRILLFLRKQRHYNGEILTEDLIKKFNTSKSRISQTLSFLTNKQYISRTYVKNFNNQGSRHKISLTQKGLGVAEGILSEGLDILEKKVIEALKNRSNYLLKNKVSSTKK